MTGGAPGRLGWLLPERPRSFAGRRALKVVLRAVHLTCAGVLVGAAVLGAPDDAFERWLLLTAMTGALLLALDLHESAAMLLQVRGAVVLLKLATVAALPWLGPLRPHALVGLMVAACVSSHAPAAVRYRLLVGRGLIAAPTSKG